ncbi:MAG: hypothetical protein JWQ09_1254 [Segetibacter sp.]|nr:hypothetical protein [Segetibacter sp.]
MKPKFVTIVILCSLLSISKSFSQKSTTVLPLTADSLATGNYKDVFKSFFQLAFDRFTSNNKEIQFTSNPFAIMAKMDTSLLKSSNYRRYNHLRNLNISFSGKLDSAYKFNGFSSGIKYAIINKRDETVSDQFITLAVKAGQPFFQINNSLIQYIAKFKDDRNKQNKLNEQRDKLFKGDITFNELDAGLKKVFRETAETLDSEASEEMINDPNIAKTLAKLYDSIRTRFHERALWTVALSDTTYKNQFFFSNVVLSTEFLKGLDDPTKALRPVGVQLNLKAALNVLDDTLKKGRDLQRSILQFEPGFNLVFRAKKALYSYAEFKFSGTYYHNFSNLYADEKRDGFTFNGTLRLRIFNDIWVPLEIKYDPDSGNIFGFLNVRANFASLKSLVTSKQ